MHLVTSSQGCRVATVGHGSPTLAHRTPVSLFLLFPPSLIPLSCSSLIAFTAPLISQIGLIDWIWFLWIEQLYWVAFSLMDRSVRVCGFVTHMHVCMLGMIEEKLPFLIPSHCIIQQLFSLSGFPAARSLQTHTQLHMRRAYTHGPSDGCSVTGGACWLRSLLIVATPWARRH